MRFILSALVFISTHSVCAADATDTFAAKVLGRFEANLEQALPPGPTMNALRTNIIMLAKRHAGELAEASKLAKALSKLPWSTATKDAYREKADQTVDAIILKLERAAIEGAAAPAAEVYLDLAKFYALLTIYPGNPAAQLAMGTSLLAPAFVLTAMAGAIIGGGYAIMTDQMPLLDVAISNGLSIGAKTGIIWISLALASKSGRKFVRRDFVSRDRATGVAEIENAFWTGLGERLRAKPALRYLVHTVPSNQLSHHFTNKLAWATVLRNDCDHALNEFSESLAAAKMK